MSARAPVLRRVACALALGLLAASGALARGAGPRTIVVRGVVLRPDGTPAAGARILAHGTFAVTATSDDRGRYSITIAMGTPGSLARGPFTLDVRAESGGRKLAFAGGGSVLSLDATLESGGTRVRVRSNSPGATAAVVTAIEQDAVPVAWIEADFGGAASGQGSAAMTAIDEASLTGAPLSHHALTSASAMAAAPHDSAPAPPAMPAAKPAPPPPATSTLPGPREVASPRAAARDSAPPHVEHAPAPRDTATRGARAATGAPGRLPDRTPRAPVAAAAPIPPVRAPGVPVRVRDSTALAPAGSGARDTLAHAHATTRDTARAAASPGAGTSAPAAAPPGTPPPATVVVAPASAPAAAESCVCVLRGTVEIQWGDSPIERGVPVTVTLSGPAARETEVELDMGPPREFEFDDLPCGTYRVAVHAHGHGHYSPVRGGSKLTVTCRRETNLRIILSRGGR